MNLDQDRLLRHGHALAEERYPYRSRTDRDAMWCLTVEAFRTARAFSALPRSGWPTRSAWPETPDEISWFAASLAVMRGEIEAADTETAAPRIVPDAATISRADAVLRLWHAHALRTTGNWRTLRGALMAKALGFRPEAIRAATGLSRQSIGNAQTRAMRDMLDALARDAQPVAMTG